MTLTVVIIAAWLIWVVVIATVSKLLTSAGERIERKD